MKRKMLYAKFFKSKKSCITVKWLNNIKERWELKYAKGNRK